jgi:DNA-binding beta-propeller fold protein YncE
MLAMSADGRRVYTANIPSGTVSVLDVETRTLLRTSGPLARVTEGLALTPDGRRIWLGSNQDHTVTVVDAETLLPVDTLPAPGFPYRAAATADGRRVVVPNPMASLLRVFDAATLREQAAVTIPGRYGAADGSGPVGVAVSPDGRTAYVSLQERSQVAVVDLERGVVAAFWEVGSGPDGIAYARRRR